MKAPIAVLDTNLYLSYLLSPNPIGSIAGRLIDAAATGAYALLLPAGVIAELHAVATRPRLFRRISRQQLEALVMRVAEFSVILPEPEDAAPRICRDPDDDYLVAAAILHNAQYLVTRDQDLLSLGSVLDLKIVDPATFLELISKGSDLK